MNKASFLTLVRQASRISDQDVEELEKLVVNFPYCQTAHLLIAKAAYDKGSMLSNQKLKKAAIYAANRQLLKKLIYTSDATVSLQPLETPDAVFETTEKAAPLETISPTTIPIAGIPEPEFLEETDAYEVEPDADISGQAIPGETKTETNVTEFVTLPAEPISEPDYEDAAIAGEILLEETNDILAQASEPPVTETKNEDAAVYEEIQEDGSLPEAEAKSSGTSPGPEIAGIAETQQDTISPEFSKETIGANTGIFLENAGAETIPESSGNGYGTEETETNAETEQGIAIKLSATEGKENVAETDKEVADLVAEAAHTLTDVPDLHELFLENAPEILEEETAEETETKTEAEAETETTAHLNDDLLHETLASFDQYLFRPEKEAEETTVTEVDLKVVYPENVIQNIYEKDSIGYWMNSSRLGECLEFKNDLTTSQPYEFRPELIWEYGKTHELQKEIKPTASKLSKQLEIIDGFLKMTPRLKTMANAKIKTEAQEDLSSKSSKINKNLASENFANILVQQGKIKKAIKIYEHLILKIPEKKPYFVSQIEKLQNLE